MKATLTRKMAGGLALAAPLSVGSIAAFGHRGGPQGGADGWRGFGRAQGPGGHGRGGPGRGGPCGGLLGPFARDLNLTDAQKAALAEHRQKLEQRHRQPPPQPGDGGAQVSD